MESHSRYLKHFAACAGFLVPVPALGDFRHRSGHPQSKRSSENSSITLFFFSLVLSSSNLETRLLTKWYVSCSLVDCLTCLSLVFCFMSCSSLGSRHGFYHSFHKLHRETNIVPVPPIHGLYEAQQQQLWHFGSYFIPRRTCIYLGCVLLVLVVQYSCTDLDRCRKEDVKNKGILFVVSFPCCDAYLTKPYARRYLLEESCYLCMGQSNNTCNVRKEKIRGEQNEANQSYLYGAVCFSLPGVYALLRVLGVCICLSPWECFILHRLALPSMSICIYVYVSVCISPIYLFSLSLCLSVSMYVSSYLLSTVRLERSDLPFIFFRSSPCWGRKLHVCLPTPLASFLPPFVSCLFSLLPF